MSWPTESSRWNAVFVAVLRIAIGWHFLYEGLWKLMQTEGWSCASYLNASQGPLAAIFKWMASQGWIVGAGDWAVMIGLVAIGLSLVSGVLARVAALFGIALMAMFYCCLPAAGAVRGGVLRCGRTLLRHRAQRH